MPEARRCPRCGGYEWDSQDRCLGKGCGYEAKPSGSPGWWGGKDWQPHEARPPREAQTPHLTDPPELHTCPACVQVALYWDGAMKLYKCLNNRCGHWFAREEIGG